MGSVRYEDASVVGDDDGDVTTCPPLALTTQNVVVGKSSKYTMDDDAAEYVGAIRECGLCDRKSSALNPLFKSRTVMDRFPRSKIPYKRFCPWKIYDKKTGYPVGKQCDLCVCHADVNHAAQGGRKCLGNGAITGDPGKKKIFQTGQAAWIESVLAQDADLANGCSSNMPVLGTTVKEAQVRSPNNLETWDFCTEQFFSDEQERPTKDEEWKWHEKCGQMYKGVWRLPVWREKYGMFPPPGVFRVEFRDGTVAKVEEAKEHSKLAVRANQLQETFARSAAKVSSVNAMVWRLVGLRRCD